MPRHRYRLGVRLVTLARSRARSRAFAAAAAQHNRRDRESEPEPNPNEPPPERTLRSRPPPPARADETPLIEQGSVLLGGVEQDFGFALRQQYFHKCVILVVAHEPQSFTRGIILNRPSE